ncbi:MAG: acylneuraminate cytidylyltransferase family protein [Nitrospinota bacterium]|nr:acylneuraminate cytidylyltransferase family protein [Nitrospinota bacterium]
MKILAIIPARGGSKRIPGKNLKLLGDKPLIVWSIEVALASKSFDRVMVSTEDSKIAEVSKNFGAEVPWLRPAHLASDEATSEDVVIDFLNRINTETGAMPDALMLLQPTSPFRTVRSIHRAIDLFEKSGGDSIVSVSPPATHPYLCKVLDENGEMKPFIPDQPEIHRTQDLPAVYQLDGVIYLASTQNILVEKNFYSKHTRGLIIDDPHESIDIDTPFDWLMAETILAESKRKGIP